MSTPLASLLTQLFPVILLLVLGGVIRTRGPQGLVHGLVDWNQVDEPTRRRAGRMVGNVLFAMAALIAGTAVYRYRHPGDTAGNNLATVILVGGISLLGIAMIFMLLRLQDKKRKHGR